MSQTNAEQIATVKRAAMEGGNQAMEFFRTELDFENKVEESSKVVNPGDIVTDADRAAQKKVIETIADNYPSDTIVGEENDELKSVPESGTVWVIDPIDGTYNFARGNGYWATSIALVQDGNPIAAANFLPAMDDLYVASPGQTTRNGTQVTVSGRSEPKYSNIAPIVIPDYGHREHFANATRNMIMEFGNIRRYGSAQVTCSLVACGVLEAAVTHRKLNPWDSIAGAYMIEEAGGKVTDLSGNKWQHNSQGLVVSNGQSHEKILELAQIMANNK